MQLKTPLFASRKSAQDVREGHAPIRTNSSSNVTSPEVSPNSNDAQHRKARSASFGTSNHSQGASGDSDTAAPQQKRTSFGFGLGLTSLTKAGDKVKASSLTRKQGNSSAASVAASSNATAPTTGSGSGTSSPGTPGGSPPQTAIGGPTATAASTTGNMGPPQNPDPQLLGHYSLKLNDLINKAFLPCAVGSAAGAMQSATSVVANGVTRTLGVAGGAGGNATAAAGPNGGALRGDTIGIPTLSVISYEGRKLPDRAKVLDLATTVTQQLRYAHSIDAYLLRAVARQILKALTLFSTRIDSLLVPSSKDPNTLRIPTTPKEGRILPPAMEFNIGLVAIEWIVEDALERCLEGDEDVPPMPRFVSEILTPVRKHMEATILHVIQPILSGTKASITACIQKAVAAPFTPSTAAQVTSPAIQSPMISAASDRATSPHPAPKPNMVSGDVSPSGKVAGSSDANGINTAWVKELDGRLAGCRRLLVARIENRTSKDGEGWFISVAIYIIWKALLILSARNAEPIFMCSTLGGLAATTSAHGSLTPLGGTAATTGTGPPPGSSAVLVSLADGASAKRNPSPAQLSSALKAVALSNKARRSESADASRVASGVATPAGATLGALGSCHHQPVPDGGFYRCKRAAQILSDLQAFDRLIREFCSGFIPEPNPLRRSKLGAHVVSSSTDDSPDAADNEEEEEESSSSDDDDEEDELARAALAEALLGLKSITTCVQVLEVNPQAVCLALRTKSQAREAMAGSEPPQALPAETVRAFKAAPPLILLQVLYNRLPLASGRVQIPAPHEIFGLTWDEYEKSIAGFVAGHTWADALLMEWKPCIESAFDALLNHLEHAEKEFATHREQKSDDRVLRHKTSNLSSVSRSSNTSTTDLQALANSTSALDKAKSEGAAQDPRLTRSRDPSPEAGHADEDRQLDKDKPIRAPRFWRTNSGTARNFILPSLSRTTSPKGGRVPAELTLIAAGGIEADAATVAKLTVEEIKTECRLVKLFARNLEAVAQHMNKNYKLDL